MNFPINIFTTILRFRLPIGNVADSFRFWSIIPVRIVAVGSFAGCLFVDGLSITNGWTPFAGFHISRRTNGVLPTWLTVYTGKNEECLIIAIE